MPSQPRASNQISTPTPRPATATTANAQVDLLARLHQRAQAHAMAMIYLANNRQHDRTDPKVGGHPSACSSSLHMLGLLHLVERRPEDFMAVKPHASPVDHAFTYALRLLREPSGDRMSDERARLAMKHLRHFSQNKEPAFQSYHSAWDPDHWGFLPSGSVGIPPVAALYLASAFKMAEKHELFAVTQPHFWCLMGDSEFREGSLLEAMPEARERDLANVTWIIDYNRQSLDGNRTHSEDATGFKDCDRIDGVATANGWEVIQLRHGTFRKTIFAGTNGDALQSVFETALPDGELQALLVGRNAKTIVNAVGAYDKAAAKVLSALNEADVLKLLNDFGGHDIESILEAYRTVRADEEKPAMIIAHTIKGWGLQNAALAGNHSMMIDEPEVQALLTRSGTKSNSVEAFERYAEGTEEANFLKSRGDTFFAGMTEIERKKQNNLRSLEQELKTCGWSAAAPTEVGINLKLVPVVHTQWVLGQLTAKLNRIGDFVENKDPAAKQKPLTSDETKWKFVGSHLVTMAPDVGTSTNLNASMDQKTFGPVSSDFGEIYKTNDKSAPDITPSEETRARHLRFEIAESNTMSCVGSFGKMGELMGIPFIPVMTVYDFFIKRALDQFFYNAYWKSHFILVGTPSGVSLSPEGAQHGWKSDIQIANMITWEPAYGIEMDWIFTESVRRHLNSFRELETDNAEGRNAVVIRGVTRSVEQKTMLERLRKHARFTGKPDVEILEATRVDCLAGGWYVVDHRGASEYKPGENVVNIFSMGVMITEALAASDKLLAQGIFANVVQVSSPDLLSGNLARDTNYKHLRDTLAVDGDLYLRARSAKAAAYPPLNFGPSPRDRARLGMLGAARVPIVSVHDGEPGLLDNLGSVVGVRHETLAVRKHSKSGTPTDIYKYHSLDASSVADACVKILEETAWASPVHIDN